MHGSRTHPRTGSCPSNRFEDGEAHRDPSTPWASAVIFVPGVGDPGGRTRVEPCDSRMHGIASQPVAAAGDRAGLAAAPGRPDVRVRAGGGAGAPTPSRPTRSPSCAPPRRRPTRPARRTSTAASFRRRWSTSTRPRPTIPTTARTSSMPSAQSPRPARRCRRRPRRRRPAPPRAPSSWPPCPAGDHAARRATAAPTATAAATRAWPRGARTGATRRTARPVQAASASAGHLARSAGPLFAQRAGQLADASISHCRCSARAWSSSATRPAAPSSTWPSTAPPEPSRPSCTPPRMEIAMQQQVPGLRRRASPARQHRRATVDPARLHLHPARRGGQRPPGAQLSGRRGQRLDAVHHLGLGAGRPVRAVQRNLRSDGRKLPVQLA